jgi:hypothetical protein
MWVATSATAAAAESQRTRLPVLRIDPNIIKTPEIDVAWPHNPPQGNAPRQDRSSSHRKADAARNPLCQSLPLLHLEATSHTALWIAAKVG